MCGPEVAAVEEGMATGAAAGQGGDVVNVRLNRRRCGIETARAMAPTRVGSSGRALTGRSARGREAVLTGVLCGTLHISARAGVLRRGVLFLERAHDVG